MRQPATNADAWIALREFIDDSPRSGTDRWCVLARRLLDSLEARSLDKHFRAGQSMQHLVFSTLDDHHLEDEPRVTVVIDASRDECRIAYARTNLHSADPPLETTVTFDDCESVLVDYLARLWADTRPQVRLPAGCAV